MDLLFLIVFFFVMVIMVLIGIIVIAYVWLAPVLPYIKAKWNHKDIVLLIGKDNKIRLIPVKYSSKVFVSSTPPYTFLQRIPKAYRLGDVNAVLVDDGWGVVIDPDMNAALEKLAEYGYTDYDKLKEALRIKEKKGTVGDEELDRILTAVEIHGFKEIPIHNILAYVADMTGGELKAYVDEKTEEVLKQYKLMHGEGGDKGNTTMIIMVIVVIALIVAGAKMMGFF
jgi:hypothetical protein